MNTDQEVIQGTHDSVTSRIIGVYYDVYNDLGYGFLESIYQAAMVIALTHEGLRVEAEVPISVYFRGQAIGFFKADLIVNGSVLIELKAGEVLLKQHELQTLHYLRSTKIEVALLMNFGPQPRFKRFVMDNAKKEPRTDRRSSV